jgi:hypothetical protein
MRENVHKDVYRFAYDEASAELRKILKAFEQLCAQKNRVEKLMEVLKPELGMPEEATGDNHVNRLEGDLARPEARHFAPVLVEFHSTN